jgi:hypothetical protein
MLSASAQDGFRATQDNPTAANRAEVHLHNYDEFDKKVSKRLPLPKLRPQPHSQVMDNGIATSSGAVDLS